LSTEISFPQAEYGLHRGIGRPFLKYGGIMSKVQSLASAVLLVLAATAFSQTVARTRPTIVYDGTATQVAAAEEESKDLWVTLADLTRATKFELKPQGVCREQLCFAIPEARKQEFVAKRSSGTWFNLSEFARLLKQPVAHDSGHALWYFGPRPETQNGYITTLTAPNFTLPDLKGKMHSLTDFRGKKVLLITWGSW
jgi:hypothetical protein